MGSFLSQEDLGSTTTVMIMCWKRGERDGVPRKETVYNKAPYQMAMTDLYEQSCKMIEEYRLPLERFSLFLQNGGRDELLDMRNISTFFAALGESNYQLTPSFIIELRFDSDFLPNSSSEEGESQVAVPKRQPFIVVDGNVSSMKAPFLRLLMQRLPAAKAKVTLREDAHQKDRLCELYRCAKNPNDKTPASQRFKDLECALAITNQMMENYEYSMCHSRHVARVFEHSGFLIEFVFRPVWEVLQILTARQCQELTKRFKDKVDEQGLPDLFILLRVKPEKALERSLKKQGSPKHNYEEDVTLEYLEALDKNFDQKYLPAIKEYGGVVIELTVDREDDSTAEPEDLLTELREKLLLLDCPSVEELRRVFGCKEEQMAET